MQRFAFKICHKYMRKMITFCMAVLFTTTVVAQVGKRADFIFMAGPLYTTKTNLQHINIINPGIGGYIFNEKATAGLSFQTLISFYLSKKWHINTGLDIDEKGFITKGGASSGTASGPVSFDNHKIAFYAGAPLSIERYLLGNKKMQLTIDAGILQQWKISSALESADLLSNQFSLMGGVYGKFSLKGKGKILVHPVFRYSLSQIQSPLINDSKSPSFNAYSIGLEVGYSF